MNMTEQQLAAILEQNPALKVRDAQRPAIKSGMGTKILRPQFESQAEEKYYNRRILPGLLSGIIISCDTHKSFEVVEELEHCGRKYKSRIYTPDFIVTYSDGAVEAVEVKGKEVKKLQRDYPLRRQLFIIKYCVPNRWKFIEVRAEEL